MRLEINSDAARNYNLKADALIAKVVEIHPPPQENLGSFSPDIHIQGHFDTKDIVGGMTLFSKDRWGNIRSKNTSVGDKQLGLLEEGYQELVGIAKGILKNRQLKEAVSFETLSNQLFDWVITKSVNKNNLSMTDYVISECEKLIEESEIWIPISALHIQSEFEIGKVTFKTISREMLDEWERSTRSAIPNMTDDANVKLGARFIKHRKEMQGFAAATIKVTAEKQRAYEIAYEEANTAISLLRVFAPMNYSPTTTCYCAPLGKQHVDGQTILLVKNENIVGLNSRISGNSPEPWFLDDRELFDCAKCGLGVVSNWAKEGRKTDFQESLFSALLLYSRSSLAKEISDKLVYILVSLESMLLRDQNEPIQDNLSSRMALLSDKTPQERKEIVQNVKRIYSIRSQFIHHGQNVDTEHLIDIETFMGNAWLTIGKLIQIAHAGTSKQDFFDDLELRRLSG